MRRIRALMMKNSEYEDLSIQEQIDVIDNYRLISLVDVDSSDRWVCLYRPDIDEVED